MPGTAKSENERERARVLADRSLVAHRRGDEERAMQLARKALLLARDARANHLRFHNGIFICYPTRLL